MAADFFSRNDPRFGPNMANYFELVRENDLALTHALTNPQVDRSKRDSQLDDPYIALGVVRETADGIIVRGARMLATWMSYDDFEALIDRIFTAPLLGCPIVFGVSDNDRGLWDNSAAAFLGWRPKDNAEIFRAEVDAAMPVPPRDDSRSRYHGGHFIDEPIFAED